MLDFLQILQCIVNFLDKNVASLITLLATFFGAWSAHLLNIKFHKNKQNENNKTNLSVLIVYLIELFNALITLRKLFLEKEKDCILAEDYLKNLKNNPNTNIPTFKNLFIEYLNIPFTSYNAKELSFLADINCRVYQVFLILDMRINDLRQVIFDTKAFTVDAFGKQGYDLQNGAFREEQGSVGNLVMLCYKTKGILYLINYCLRLAYLMEPILNNMGERTLKNFKKLPVEYNQEREEYLPSKTDIGGFEAFDDVEEAFKKITLKYKNFIEINSVYIKFAGKINELRNICATMK